MTHSRDTDHAGGQLATGVVMIGLAAAIAAWDVRQMIRYGARSTITGVVRTIAERWPVTTSIAAFAAGALYGHLFLCPLGREVSQSND